MEQVYIKGMNFQTDDGKQVLFNGINVVCKEKAQGYFFPNLEKKFLAFRNMGFNLIRFGIFWDGVEPQPGKYDMEYLAKVKEAIMLAEKYELYVMVDMHQDLFARKYEDGAPDWATLDEGAYHPEGCTMWYDAYLQSEAIIKAADNFWANKEAEDGVGLLDHYEKMWEQIVQYLDDCSNIIGWEPMNEPFMGSLARNAFGIATMKTKEQFPEFDLGNPTDATLEQQALFMGYVTEQLQEFDRTTLMDFYYRMERAVSRYSTKPLITGGNIYSSSNVRTGIQRLDQKEKADAGNGNVSWGKQIYAPHGYDSVVDSDCYENFSRENVERLFADKRSSQEELGLPLIVGEWGAFPSKSFTNDLIRHMNEILERYLWSSTYWEYLLGMEEDANYSALCRAYPMETAGELQFYHYDEEKKCLEMTFMAAKGESKVYCPFQPKSVTGKGSEGERQIEYKLETVDEAACYVFLQTEKAEDITICING
ncbi:MAG: glycoside hydrolase family 5 protein [Lachnospiraceae bacterium]|nr:glycoside hydrolase family 5 protein [Lachnospiraceae bacterium]